MSTSKLFLLALFCLLALPLYATNRIHIIELQNRPAQEVLPIVLPLLKDSESASGSGFQLFLNTSSNRAKEIEALLKRIDVAQQMLTIEVSHNADHLRAGYGIGADVRIDTGDVSASAGAHERNDEGVTVYGGQRDTNKRNVSVRKIQVLEGKPAYIYTEQTKHLPGEVVTPYADGFIIIDTPYENTATQGFEVIVQLQGDEHAHVQVSAIYGSHKNLSNRKQQMSADTTLNVPLGKWFKIADTQTEKKRTEKGLLYSTQVRSENKQSLFLRVHKSTQ